MVWTAGTLGFLWAGVTANVPIHQGDQIQWIPEPYAFEMPSASAVSALASAYVRKNEPLGCCEASAQASGRGADRVNVLVPSIFQLFKLMLIKACLSECWEAAKITPLHKKGHVLDPGNYRMLAVSGTMYCLYANVLREVVTDWYKTKNRTQDPQFSFYPGRNTCSADKKAQLFTSVDGGFH
eukprot:1157169-Pelagomonas_calceolata.AAC.2